MTFDEIALWYVLDDLDARIRAVLWCLPPDIGPPRQREMA
jgi:hypothetical protein